MEPSVIGKVLVRAKIENLADLTDVQRGLLPAGSVRTLEVNDALVDTGATMLSMPLHLINQLGLNRRRTRRVRTAGGIRDMGIYDGVQLTIQGRDCLMEVGELPDECPVLIGQIPLEALDWVVDPIGQQLIGNPEHNGEHMTDCF
ncbi:MAG TPA: retroviral-like aspartic protease family protein [Pirellulales bacterium]|nr:retroviral-like aspartic protease family protein [Pirellulales bacterium]